MKGKIVSAVTLTLLLTSMLTLASNIQSVKAHPAILLDMLSDGSKQKDITSIGSENQTVYLKLPKEAHVVSAELNLSGVSGVLFEDNFDSYQVGTNPTRWQCSENEPGQVNVINTYSRSPPNSLQVGGEYGANEISSSVDTLQDPIAINVSLILGSQYNGGANHHVIGTYVTVLDNQNRGIFHLHLGSNSFDPNNHVWVSNDSYTYYYYDPNLGGWYWAWASEVEIYSAPKTNNDWNDFQFVLINQTHYQVSWHAPSTSGSTILERNNASGLASKLKFHINTCGGAVFDDVSITYQTTRNVFLDTADSGLPWEWINTGEFNQSISPQNVNLNTSLINDYLFTATPDAEGNVLVPLLLHSDSSGIVNVSDIAIYYEMLPISAYTLTIVATSGGTTNPLPGVYTYSAGSFVQVTAYPNTNYALDHWELATVNVGSANPYTVPMDKNHTLKAVFSPIPPSLSASISPLSASILVGQSVTFTSTVSGGYTPYSYQWYLNSAPVSDTTLASWTFMPSTGGIYYVYLRVTDASTNTSQSETARITVATVPVGGYSVAIGPQTKAEPVLPYIALVATLTAVFTKLRPKTKRKR